MEFNNFLMFMLASHLVRIAEQAVEKMASSSVFEACRPNFISFVHFFTIMIITMMMTAIELGSS